MEDYTSDSVALVSSLIENNVLKKNVVFVGYSLGAVAAQVCALFFNAPAVLFSGNGMT